MKILWAGAALAGALLSGCASVTTGVSASAAPGALAGTRTYDFARTAAQADNADYRQVETLVRRELAQRGFDEAADAQARYRVTIAYATQPASVALTMPGCGGAQQPACVVVDGPAPFALPFAGTVYRHVLTLRFVERSSGAEAYRVSAAVQDRRPDALRAAPALVRSALARVPYTDGKGWLVETKKSDADAMPGVVSVKPARSN
ncbi:DUF4136 domain-containing protein [Burkholderia oklahomensis]|uniref:DUF4136 domain-containing protein n=1 Tax=Burkholderia oklahomensis TaxID=342113 RepID=UPI00016A7C2A|nr:DUF4136 domain-containing protein [Burkholderia oklahomensis]AJX32600.1 hypothetical protein BG90_3642 [Burkholderia oklahomensis C6786]AOI46220.1 hypothetical protein WI23_10745 [Burkholderia oklahomensis C6786]KUY64099.1 hypothetical protein WI23_06505 [Burkholderia oklahomensis C6786]MBI0361204.1 DUF4136 domain-containing protein [Burkholderia oklahomensis]SUW54939.1 Uncharacterised protein [Burkholderia oklahomensis]